MLLSRRSRRFGAVHLLVLSFVGCTTLTQVDWSRIPAEEATAGSAGSGGGGGTGNDSAGQPSSGGAEGGQLGNGGEGGVSQGGAATGGEGAEAGAESGGSVNGGSGGAGGAGGTGGGGASGGGVGGTGVSGGGNGGSGGSDTVSPKCSTYPAKPAQINLTGKLVLFDGGAQAAGVEWGGRDGLDAKCAAAAPAAGVNKQQFRAFISAQADEDLSSGVLNNFISKYNIPTNGTVVSPFGITMASSVGDITSFNLSLICAGVVHEDVTAWISGVKEGGASDATYNCGNFTQREDSQTVRAGVGRTDTINKLFNDHSLADRRVSCASTTAHILCLGWED
jgi:hypothetical protein